LVVNLRFDIMFNTLNQTTYLDDQGHSIEAAKVDFIAPYQYGFDGFYKWQCGSCKFERATRSCGWSIAGQVLECESCHKRNLLVKTNCTEIDECIGMKNRLEVEIAELKHNQDKFQTHLKYAVAQKLAPLSTVIDGLLRDFRESEGKV